MRTFTKLKPYVWRCASCYAMGTVPAVSLADAQQAAEGAHQACLPPGLWPTVTAFTKRYADANYIGK